MSRTSAVDKAQLRRLWEEGETPSDISKKLGISLSSVYKTASTEGLSLKGREVKNKHDPTIEEIYAAAAAIRATWPAERFAQSGAGGWKPPKV
jgi:hypothetical protein